MNKELRGKEIISCSLRNCQRLQKIGFVNRDSSDFDKLVGRKIVSVISRGNVIRVKLEGDMNLILAPEYGGRILFHSERVDAPMNYHLRLQFKDSTALTVSINSMGLIQTLRDEQLGSSYIYKRDFSSTLSPTECSEFTLENLSNVLAASSVNIKSALVGKNAVLVGLSNFSFQDILYLSRIHPKRKASSLKKEEKLALYNTIVSVIENRIRLGGKEQFFDLYGKKGQYRSAMGSNTKDKKCAVCGSRVEKINLGGGLVYFCPICQV
jgi:formamidopyrimidine-DNA glycosylase